LASEVLNKAGRQFNEQITAALRGLPEPDPLPQRLYHFTDTSGLVGVLQSQSLWASLATSLNDRSEIEYALDLARGIIDRREVGGNPAFLEAVALHLYPRRALGPGSFAQGAYVCSFCINRDQSAQWLHYGRSGTGCALAFASGPLLIPGSGFLLMPVVYDAPQQDRVLRNFLRSMSVTLDRLVEEYPQDEEKVRLLAIECSALGVSVLAVFLKNLAFMNDGEWRLMVADLGVALEGQPTSVPKTMFRCVNNRVVPYKAVRYDALPLVGITLGASAALSTDDPGLAVLLTEAMPGQNILVEKSLVPVRP